MGTPLDTAEEYLEDQHSLDSESDYDCRLAVTSQIIKYLKYKDLTPTYGMVFDMETLICHYLCDMLQLVDTESWHDTLGNKIRGIIRENTDVEVSSQ